MKTIMIVDEQQDVLEQVRTILENEDVTLVTATNSRQALEYLKEENEETFDLILVNTPMPGSIKSNALFSMAPRSKKQAGGIENFLQKPFTTEQFLNFVKQKIRTE